MNSLENRNLKIVIENILRYIKFNEIKELSDDIIKGNNYLELYNIDIQAFRNEKDNIIKYNSDICEKNKNDVIKDKRQVAFITKISNMPLSLANIVKVYYDLENEIDILKIKAMYQIVKHNDISPNDKVIIQQLM